ncbi:hypothetical protein DER44DRAFT_806909 [Fusarium oxysporum]|nr:hypothetical protein DER44DRAFT_806909 [Fusarium oxysporum]
MANNQQQSAVAQKANFTDLYNQQDPRGYPTTLAPLQYTIPQQVLPLFQRLHQLFCRGTTAPAILDTWTGHYTGSKLDPKQQALADRGFFASRERSPKPVVLGIDKTDHAVRYALDAGLIDAGFRKALHDVSLIICTGGVSYLSSQTFARIVAAVGRSRNLWVASTVIRTSSYDEIAAALREDGLVNERLPGVVLPARGLDPNGLEDKGYVCGNVFISRCVEDTSRPPITELVADLGGL